MGWNCSCDTVILTWSLSGTQPHLPWKRLYFETGSLTLATLQLWRERAEMTDLDQYFCMWYFLCIWLAASKYFVLFFYSDPLKKVVLSEVGAFSKNAVRTAFLACFFSLYRHATSPPCQKCCTYRIRIQFVCLCCTIVNILGKISVNIAA